MRHRSQFVFEWSYSAHLFAEYFKCSMKCGRFCLNALLTMQNDWDIPLDSCHVARFLSAAIYCKETVQRDSPIVYKSDIVSHRDV